ncbi:MAG TPA: DUF3098 domain-containing protein [Bacteroidales bacterium]|nr:DUF3098 domain-containing protein [Bacteroidales bacterium]
MNKNFALGKQNLILIGIGVAFVVLGFLLMTGAPSGQTQYNPDIFSFRRIVLAPGVALFGFIFVIFGIVKKSKDA